MLSVPTLAPSDVNGYVGLNGELIVTWTVSLLLVLLFIFFLDMVMVLSKLTFPSCSHVFP